MLSIDKLSNCELNTNSEECNDAPESEIPNDANKLKIREYVNSAVYVETMYNTNTCNQAIYIPGSGDHPKTMTIKRCVCFSNPNGCPCHPVADEAEENNTQQPLTSAKTSLTSLSAKITTDIPSESNCLEEVEEDFNPFGSPTTTRLVSSFSAVKLTSPTLFDSDSGITVKATNSTSDLRLSIPSLSSLNTSTFRCSGYQSKDENYRQWCIRKDTEKKLHEEKEQLIQKIKEQQKQAVVELERENFKRWLLAKKKEEERQKKLKFIEEKEEKKAMAEKEKRMQENELNFQLWLKRKEEKDLEKKIKHQMTLIEIEEQKQRRTEYSEKAYEIWKQHSRNKQKPVPFGLGIDTLRSSASVSYINPQPWVPNIDVNEKPRSQ